MTILVCDIVGSTRLTAELGPDRMHAVLNEFLETALKEIHRYGGTVSAFQGDGFMALFGEPITREDHAKRAALAALAIQDTLTTRHLSLLPADKQLAVRVGVHSGAVVVGKIGDDVRWDYAPIGDAANVAARLQAEAEPGTIVCSGAVAEAAKDVVECRALGARTLKGKPEPLLVYQIVKARPAKLRESAVATPLVGRDEALAEVRAMLDTLRSGEGGILGIVGEAGIGKSRLLSEARHLAEELDLRWIEGSGLSFGGTISYWPFREIFRTCFGIGDNDGEKQSWSTLRERIVRLFGVEQGEEFAIFIAALLALPIPEPFGQRVRALDGLSMGHQIFRASIKVFERLGQEGPLVIALEDWHWGDASSADLLDHLLPLALSVPILFIIASRSEQGGPAAALRRSVATREGLIQCHRELALGPLASAEAAQLMRDLLGGRTLPPSAREMLLRRAAGNPFYLIELIRALPGPRAVRKNDRVSEVAIGGGVDSAPLPDSIEGVVLARIDRLEEEAKQVLRVAAVVGRTFMHRVLSAVCDRGPAIDTDLLKLVEAEFIDRTQRFPEVEYAFKHPLIQQVSYGSLLGDHRRQLHRRVGEAIERLFRTRLEEFHSLLAYHYAQAEHWDKAREYLLIAADRAGGMAADVEALELYQSALAAAEKSSHGPMTPLRRAEIDSKIGEALYRSGRHEQSVECMRQALQRLGVSFPATRRGMRMATAAALLRCVPALLWAHRPGAKAPPDTALSPEGGLQFRIFETLGFADYFSEPQRVLLDMLLGFNAVKYTPRSRQYVVAMGGLGAAFSLLGARWLANRCNARALQFAEATGEPGALASCYLFQGLEQEHDGKANLTVSTLRKAVDLYLEVGDLRTWKTALKLLLVALRNRGDRSWIGLNNQILQLFAEMQDQHSEAMAWSGRGYEQLLYGNFAAARSEFRRARGIYEQVPDVRNLAGSLCELGRCEFFLGNVSEAVSLVRRGAALVAEHRMGGFNATAPIMTAADVLLLAAEASAGATRSELLRDARVACAVAARHARRVRDYGAAESLRVSGLLAWLQGRRSKAEILWHEAVETAEALGTRPVLARTHLELGRRGGRAEHLERARELFAEIGATEQVALVTDLLNPSH